MPLKWVSNFDQVVTQWMSTVTSARGSDRNSSHVHRRGRATSPRTSNVHSASGVRGVGPAESTGKSCVSYWPGGIRPGAVRAPAG